MKEFAVRGTLVGERRESPRTVTETIKIKFDNDEVNKKLS
jgi:hypothetical protein